MKLISGIVKQALTRKTNKKVTIHSVFTWTFLNCLFSMLALALAMPSSTIDMHTDMKPARQKGLGEM